MIASLSHMQGLVAAALMAGMGLAASIPSVIYLFYERWTEERLRRKAEEAARGEASEGRRTAQA
jgi:biopolymer transport protein ExbB/TolQ